MAMRNSCWRNSFGALGIAITRMTNAYLGHLILPSLNTESLSLWMASSGTARFGNPEKCVFKGIGSIGLRKSKKIWLVMFVLIKNYEIEVGYLFDSGRKMLSRTQKLISKRYFS